MSENKIPGQEVTFYNTRERLNSQSSKPKGNNNVKFSQLILEPNITYGIS